MKSFIFRLESVLTLRAIAEQKATEFYAIARRNEAEAEKTLVEALAESEALNSELAERLKHNFSSTDQQLYWNTLQDRKVLCKQLAEAVTKSKKESEQKLATLMEAKKSHDILLRLKETRQKAFQQKVYRHEEITIEDLITAQHARKLSEVNA